MFKLLTEANSLSSAPCLLILWNLASSVSFTDQDRLKYYHRHPPVAAAIATAVVMAVLAVTDVVMVRAVVTGMMRLADVTTAIAGAAAVAS